jgi:hypothetical protein
MNLMFYYHLQLVPATVAGNQIWLVGEANSGKNDLF